MDKKEQFKEDILSLAEANGITLLDFMEVVFSIILIEEISLEDDSKDTEN